MDKYLRENGTQLEFAFGDGQGVKGGVAATMQEDAIRTGAAEGDVTSVQGTSVPRIAAPIVSESPNRPEDAEIS